MYMIFCVIHDPELLDEVLEAWQQAGISGVTILESTGLQRHRKRQRIPMRYGLVQSSTTESNLSLMSVVEDEALIQRCLEATEKVIGDLDGPDTGIFTAWPLGVVKGVHGSRPQPGSDAGDINEEGKASEGSE